VAITSEAGQLLQAVSDVYAELGAFGRTLATRYREHLEPLSDGRRVHTSIIAGSSTSLHSGSSGIAVSCSVKLPSQQIVNWSVDLWAEQERWRVGAEVEVEGPGDAYERPVDFDDRYAPDLTEAIVLFRARASELASHGNVIEAYLGRD
jgi:hypothetical protein